MSQSTWKFDSKPYLTRRSSAYKEPCSEEVLVYDKSGKMSIGKMFYLDRIGCVWVVNGKVCDTTDVACWRKLPSPPTASQLRKHSNSRPENT